MQYNLCHPHQCSDNHIDAELLEQVITVEIEKAVRYADITIDDATFLEWTKRVLENVQQLMIDHGSDRVLLPHELDACIHDHVIELTKSVRQPSASQGMPIFDPMRGMTHMCGKMALLCRAFFEKRLE